MNGGRSVATRIDRLCAIDHDILGLLQIRRVLTTPQLITLTQRPERTVDNRLTRLRERALVDRTRPYAASGSAFYWWLARAGARLVEGTSPAPGKGTPNPLFLRHTAAIAGLFVALCDIGPSVGLTLSEWRRDEDLGRLVGLPGHRAHPPRRLRRGPPRRGRPRRRGRGVRGGRLRHHGLGASSVRLRL